jgi:PAS domain S-box-containing protein
MKNREKPTILIIDDDPDSLNMLMRYLHEAGFKTMIAPNGERALRQLELARPDLILLDVLMPGIDGFETCRRLKNRETTKDIPVIFMTALSEMVEKLQGFEVGGVDYVTKPLQHEEVLARLNAHLTIRRLQQRLQEQNVLLEEQNTRFQTLSEATFEGIIIHDNGRILEVNQTVEKMFGYSRADVFGKDVLAFITPEYRQIATTHIQTKDETPYEVEGIRQDGSIFPIEVHARIMPYQGRDVRIVAIRDMTWRKNMERKQSLLQKENLTLRSTLHDRYKFGDIIGKSPVMQEVYQAIANASASDANVVIYGESGTGKELVAHTIHHMSDRKKRRLWPSIAAQCRNPCLNASSLDTAKGHSPEQRRINPATSTGRMEEHCFWTRLANSPLPYRSNSCVPCKRRNTRPWVIRSVKKSMFALLLQPIKT